MCNATAAARSDRTAPGYRDISALKPESNLKNKVSLFKRLSMKRSWNTL